MELIVICGAGMVIYCSYLSFQDARREWRRSSAAQALHARRKERSGKKQVTYAAAGPANGVVGRWPVPARGSF